MNRAKYIPSLPDIDPYYQDVRFPNDLDNGIIEVGSIISRTRQLTEIPLPSSHHLQESDGERRNFMLGAFERNVENPSKPQQDIGNLRELSFGKDVWRY
jgi:hypothetical protein